MTHVTIIGIELGKHSFQLYGSEADGQTQLQQTLQFVLSWLTQEFVLACFSPSFSRAILSTGIVGFLTR